MVTISPTVIVFLSSNYVNFKEKRSLISYIQQFTFQCFSLDIQLKLIYDKYLSHKFM